MRALLILFLLLSLTAPAAAGQFEDAAAAYQRGDYESAFRLLQPLAEQGDADAQFVLGVMYDNGEGVPQDYVEAAKWYRRAAEQGYAAAQFSLGTMYLYPNDYGVLYGVLQDYAEAARWYRLAAEQGYDSAQTQLGFMYDRGRGIMQDYILAHMWFNLAANQESEIGRQNRDRMAKKMTPAQIAEAQRLAREWRPK
jgi:TPR repeat protein